MSRFIQNTDSGSILKGVSPKHNFRVLLVLTIWVHSPGLPG